MKRICCWRNEVVQIVMSSEVVRSVEEIDLPHWSKETTYFPYKVCASWRISTCVESSYTGWIGTFSLKCFSCETSFVNNNVQNLANLSSTSSSDETLSYKSKPTSVLLKFNNLRLLIGRQHCIYWNHLSLATLGCASRLVIVFLTKLVSLHMWTILLTLLLCL